jgi:transposase
LCEVVPQVIAVFAHRRDLFTRLDLVFMDTTSLYFEGSGGQTLGRYGYSKDHRPDLRQMILAVASTVTGGRSARRCGHR